MSLLPARIADVPRAVVLVAALAAASASGCANATLMRHAQRAEQSQDYDRAVVEYTKLVRANPADRNARAALERVKLRAAADHAVRARRFAALERYDEALVEYQLASELNPTDSQIETALRGVRQKLRARVTVTRGGRTELETLVAKTRDMAAPGLELPDGARLPGALQFGNGATSRAVFLTVGRFANLSVIFDSAFRDQPLSIDLRNTTVADALAALTASTRTFYRVTAPRTITIVPDTAAKRREYEESVVRTFYLSNVDLKEAIDLLRVVIDI